jgi:hypothetical protein
MTILPHDSELQVMIASSLISTQITAANTKFSSTCNVFNSHFLITGSNSGDSSASAVTPFPASHRLTIELSSRLLPLITPRHVPHRTHNPSIIIGPCSPRRCIGMVVAWTTENTAFVLLRACMLRLLPSNCVQSYRLAMGLCATIYI